MAYRCNRYNPATLTSCTRIEFHEGPCNTAAPRPKLTREQALLRAQSRANKTGVTQYVGQRYDCKLYVSKVKPTKTESRIQEHATLIARTYNGAAAPFTRAH